MITPLSISEINKKADYSVERDEITGSYDFTTDYGVQISIDFDDDFMITSSVSYQLIIFAMTIQMLPMLLMNSCRLHWHCKVNRRIIECKGPSVSVQDREQVRVPPPQFF